ALIAWPGSIADKSISVVDSASTSFDGAICEISGTSVAAAPTPAAETAAISMKSRRRTPSPSFGAAGSAVPVVVAIALPCLPIPAGWYPARNRRNWTGRARFSEAPGGAAWRADRRAGPPCQQAFWRYPARLARQADQRELPAIGGFAAVDRTPIGKESCFVGIG